MYAAEAGDAGKLFLVRLEEGELPGPEMPQVAALSCMGGEAACADAWRERGGVGSLGVPCAGSTMSAFAKGSASGVRTRLMARTSSWLACAGLLSAWPSVLSA